MQDAQDVVYTVKEVATLLKCNTGYVHKLKAAGLLRFLKLGCLKCRTQEIDRFLEENEGKDLSDPFHIVDL